MIQWLELHSFTAEDLGSIPGQGTRILQAAGCGPKKKEIYMSNRKGLVQQMITPGNKGLHTVEKRANVYTILNGKSVFQNNINSIT